MFQAINKLISGRKLNVILFEKLGSGLDVKILPGKIYFDNEKLNWFLDIKKIGVTIPLPSKLEKGDKKELDLSFIYNDKIFVLREGLDKFSLLKFNEEEKEFESFDLPPSFLVVSELLKAREIATKKSFFEKYMPILSFVISIIIIIVSLFAGVQAFQNFLNVDVLKDLVNSLKELTETLKNMQSVQQIPTYTPSPLIIGQ